MLKNYNQLDFDDKVPHNVGVWPYSMPFVYEADVHLDNRGAFSVPWANYQPPSNLINLLPDQQNISISKRGTVRGMHWQIDEPLGKLVTCIQGTIIDAIVDIRQASKTFGKALMVRLDGIIPHPSQIADPFPTAMGFGWRSIIKSVWIPAGFAHGFCALEQEAIVTYLQHGKYNPSLERSFHPLDDELNIQWLIEEKHTILSEKDRNAPRFSELAKEDLL